MTSCSAITNPYRPVAVKPDASFTLRMTGYCPAFIGLPEMTPAFSESPDGRAPDARLQLYGAAPPVAVKGWEKLPPVYATKVCVTAIKG
jgi:hypothetical protein